MTSIETALRLVETSGRMMMIKVIHKGGPELNITRNSDGTWRVYNGNSGDYDTVNRPAFATAIGSKDHVEVLPYDPRFPDGFPIGDMDTETHNSVIIVPDHIKALQDTSHLFPDSSIEKDLKDYRKLCGKRKHPYTTYLIHKDKPITEPEHFTNRGSALLHASMQLVTEDYHDLTYAVINDAEDNTLVIVYTDSQYGPAKTVEDPVSITNYKNRIKEHAH